LLKVAGISSRDHGGDPCAVGGPGILGPTFPRLVIDVSTSPDHPGPGILRTYPEEKGSAMRLNDQSICLPAPRRLTRSVLGGLALLALLSGKAPAAEPETETSFQSGGKKIRVERFEPTRAGKFPAVVFLYGVDGLHKDNEETFRGAARTAASRGFVVLLVHYHDRTGTGLKDAPALMQHFQERLRNPEADGKEQQALREKFDAWEATVRDAVAHARNHAKVDGDRVALVGYSLGGFLAASVAADSQQRISAVVTLFGGIPGDKGARLEHFPYALIVSGDKDDIVPVKESYYLFGLLRAKQLPCVDPEIYKGVGHGFTKDGKPDPFTAFLAQGKILTFLCERLAPKVNIDPAKGK
jgi:dienelactone hydrolase